MKPYRPSGIAPIPGVLVAIAFALISGLIAGGLLWAADHKIGIYLIILFPAVAGFIVGLATASGTRRGKLRNPLLAGLIGLLGGLFAAGVYHFLSYEVSFKESVRDALNSQNAQNAASAPAPTALEIQQFTDAYLTDEVKDKGFAGYLKLEAKEGISITRSSSSSGIELKNGWAWGYFAIEALIMAGLGAMLASSAAGEPFDERANAWYGEPVYLGGAAGEAGTALANALKGGAFERAGGLVQPGRAELGLPRVELLARLSPDKDASEAVLEVKAVKPGKKKNEEASETLVTGLVTRDELIRLRPATT